MPPTRCAPSLVNMKLRYVAEIGSRYVRLLSGSARVSRGRLR